MVDVRLALRDLHRKTPEFYVREIPAHGETLVRDLAVEVLKKGIKPCGAAQRLLTMLT